MVVSNMQFCSVPAALALWLVPGIAMADLSCRFEQECLEGESCAESGYELQVVPQDAMVDDIEPGAVAQALGDQAIVDDAGRFDVLPLGRRDGEKSWFGISAAGAHLLTVSPQGAARYSVHFEGAEFSMLYLGQCEDAS